MSEQNKAKKFCEVAWELSKMLAPEKITFSEMASTFLGGIIEAQKDEPDDVFKIWLIEGLSKVMQERTNW